MIPDLVKNRLRVLEVDLEIFRILKLESYTLYYSNP